MNTEHSILKKVTSADYPYGFVSNIATDIAPKGLNEDTIRFIAVKKNEPDWMLAWRLKAYRQCLTMQPPTWDKVHYQPIDYQNIIYYASPQKKSMLNSLIEADHELLATF